MKHLKKIDVFGVPFQFNVKGSQKQFKTSIGGAIVLVILILGLFYFIYQNYLYFSDGYSPQSSIYLIPHTMIQKYYINEELFAFDVALTQDIKLNAFQKKVKKTYLKYKVQTVSVSKEGDKIVDIPLRECRDLKLQGYMCFDLDNLKEPLSLDCDPQFSSAWQKSLKINIVKCENEPKCAKPEDIDALICHGGSQFQIVSKIIQYNYRDQQFDYVYKIDAFSFDTQISFFSNLTLTIGDYTIKDGFLWFYEKVRSGINSMQKSIESKTSNVLDQVKKEYIYGIVSLYLADKAEQIEVTYPLYTDALAQFASVFSALLILGELARIFAQSQMDESITNVFLYEQFKRTLYLQLQKSHSKPDPDSPKNNEGVGYSSQLKKTLENIQQSDFKQMKKNNNGFSYKLSKYFRKILPKRNNKKDQDEQRVEMMEKCRNENICIFDMYRSIVQMKQMLRLLLTKEQYSAMKFCGMNLDVIIDRKQKLQNKNKPETKDRQNTYSYKNGNDEEIQQRRTTAAVYRENEQEQNNSHEDNELKNKVPHQAQYTHVNHLENLEIIDMDQEELYWNLNKFLDDVKTQLQVEGHVDPLTSRIYDSLFIPHERID